MSTSQQDAVDAIAAALTAVDWMADLGQAVTIDTNAGRSWEIEDLQRCINPVCYVSRQGRRFTQIMRNRWNVSLLIGVTVIKAVQAEGSAGLVKPESFAPAEAVLEAVVPGVLTHLSSRFGIDEIDQPVGHDDDRMAQLIYVSQITFALSDQRKA